MLMAQREAEFFRKQDIFPASGGAFCISNPHLKDYPLCMRMPHSAPRQDTI